MLYKGVRNFLHNIRDSFRFSLRELHKKAQKLENKSLRRLDDDMLIETILYAIENSDIKRPIIKTAEETVNKITNWRKSIARFGDGEILVAEGQDIGFQKADARLSEKLRSILSHPQENLLVGIPHSYYYSHIGQILQNANPTVKDFNLYAVPVLRRILDKYLNKEMVFFEMGITVDKKLFSVFRKFFENKKLVLVGCKEAFQTYKFNIFDSALQLDYEFVPNKHCFSVYDELLAKLLRYDKDVLMILMCGPTATVLAADLAEKGFQALDLGHLAKAYDWHKRGVELYATSENVTEFFAPDE